MGFFMLTRLFLTLALTGLVACGAQHRPSTTTVPEPDARPQEAPRRAQPEGGFRSPEGHAHPLLGAVLRTEDGQLIGWDALLAELSKARVVLLGERHDNPDHHLLQAAIYAALAGTTPAPAAAFEMLDAGDQQKVQAVVQGEPASPEALAQRLSDAVAWKDSGWPDFALYQPVFERVLAAGAPLFAAGLPRDQAMDLARGKPLPATGAFDDQIEARYRLAEPLPDAVMADMRTLMQEAHCGVLPEAMLGGMVRIQRIRDALLADAARLGVEASGRAVVFAGAGHVRRDRAAARLLALAGTSEVASVALREVDDDQLTPETYLDAARGVFDYVVLTARLPAEDHCQALRERFKAHGDGSHSHSQPD